MHIPLDPHNPLLGNILQMNSHTCEIMLKDAQYAVFGGVIGNSGPGEHVWVNREWLHHV